MNRNGLRLVLLLGGLLALPFGCPRQPNQPPGVIPTTPIDGTTPPVTSVTCNLPPDPGAQLGVPSQECTINTVGRRCAVPMGTTVHPCQDPSAGTCGASGLCEFQWLPDGTACGNGQGECREHRCQCRQTTSLRDRPCGGGCGQQPC